MRDSWLLAVLAVLLLGACSGGGNGEAPAPPEDNAAPAARFCDAFLDYLSDPTDANLRTAAEASGNESFEELAAIVDGDDDTGRIVAADVDLRSRARDRCQTEWTAGAQGAGNVAGAAEAFYGALVAGDRLGAANVASANALAVFDPWAPLAESDDPDIPSILSVGERSFTMVLGPARLAECEVEFGVVITCTVLED